MPPINPKVVDLSHYDDVQDGFTGAIKFGIRGVINKVTDGTSFRDPSFGWRREPAKNTGLLYGGYHFLRPGNIIAQANFFLQNLGDTVGLVLALDMEVPGISPSDAQTWIEHVHGTVGRWPWLYSYSAYLGEHWTKADIANPFWKQIPLWIAAYNDHPTWPPCWESPVLWQFTGDGSGPGPHNVPGITIEGDKGIDINSFDGTDEQLAAVWAA